MPPPPTNHIMPDDIDVEWFGYHWSVIDVIHQSALVATPYEEDGGYLEWYYHVSHPRLVPPPRDALREVPVPTYEVEPAGLGSCYYFASSLSDPSWF